MTLSFAVLSFLLTYLIHSTLLLGGVWLLLRLRAVRTPAVEDALWKLALVGGVLTASLQVGLDVRPLGGHLRLDGQPARTQAAFSHDAALLVDAGTHAGQIPVLDARFSPLPADRVTLRTSPITRRATSGHTPLSRDALTPAVLATPVSAPAGTHGSAQSPILPAPAPARLPSLADAEWQDVLVLLWAGVAALGLLSFGRSHLRLHRALGRRRRVHDVALLAILERLTEHQRLHGRVRLSVSPLLSGPVALGHEIVLPRRALTDLAPRQQEAMLAHELGHVARRDPLWLQLGAVLSALFFFQPLNRVGRRRLSETSEFLCDDWAVARTGRGLVLAQCLAQVATWVDDRRAPELAAGMVRKDRSFLRRVERLAHADVVRRRLRPAHGLALALVVVGMVSCSVPGVSWGDDDEPSLLQNLLHALQSALVASQAAEQGPEPELAELAELAEVAEVAEVAGDEEPVRPAVVRVVEPRRFVAPVVDEPAAHDPADEDFEFSDDVELDLEFLDALEFDEDFEFDEEFSFSAAHGPHVALAPHAAHEPHAVREPHAAEAPHGGRHAVIAMGDDGSVGVLLDDEWISFDELAARLAELDEPTRDADVLWHREGDGGVVIRLRSRGLDDDARARERSLDARERVRAEREAAGALRDRARAAEDARQATERALEAERASADREYEQARRELERAIERMERDYERELERAAREYERALRDYDAESERREAEVGREFGRRSEELERQELEFSASFDGDEDERAAWLDDWQSAMDDAVDAYDDAMETLTQDAEDAYTEFERVFDERSELFEDGFEDRLESLSDKLEDLDDEFAESYDAWLERIDEHADLRDCDHDCEDECAHGCTHPDEFVLAEWDAQWDDAEWEAVMADFGDFEAREWTVEWRRCEPDADAGSDCGDAVAPELAEPVVPAEPAEPADPPAEAEADEDLLVFVDPR